MGIGDKAFTVNQTGIIGPSCANLPARATFGLFFTPAYTFENAYNGPVDGNTFRLGLWILSKILSSIKTYRLHLKAAITAIIPVMTVNGLR